MPLMERSSIVQAESNGPPCGSAGKEAACNEGDLSSIPGLGKSPGGGNGFPLQSHTEETA